MARSHLQLLSLCCACSITGVQCRIEAAFGRGGVAPTLLHSHRGIAIALSLLAC